MKKYAIYYGLSGGFGGSRFSHIHEFPNEDQAYEYAYECACGQYDDYAGTHGLRSIIDIMEQDELDETDAFDIYFEERESWLSYEVIEVQEDQTEEDFEE